MEGRTDKTRVEFIQVMDEATCDEEKVGRRRKTFELFSVLIHRLRLFYSFLPGLCGELLLNEIIYIYIYISYIFCIIIIILI